MTDPDAKAALTLLSVAYPAALATDENLYALLICSGVRISLERGNDDDSSVAYASFGLVLGAFFENYLDAYRFGKTAISLVDTHHFLGKRATVYLIFGNRIIHWVEPFEKAIPFMQEAYRTGIETGNLTYACYAANLLVSMLLTLGTALDEVQRESEVRLEFVRSTRFAGQINSILTSQLYIQKMRGRGEIDEVEHERALIRTPWPIGEFIYLVRMLQVHVFFERYDDALKAASRAYPLLWTAPNFIQTADYVFFHALALSQTRQEMELLRNHGRRLRIWAESCAENFLDRAALVAAEIARLDGQELEAERLYEQAIRAASDNGLVQNEALACELCAKFHFKRGFEVVGRAYLQAARAAYARWGAEAKVDEMDRRHPWMVQSEVRMVQTDTFAAEMSELDFLSAIKASQTISQQIRIGDLSKTLMQVVMEQGGAECGCLILSEEGRLMVRVMAQVHGQEVRTELLQGVSLEGSGHVPETIVDFAVRSGKPVNLADAVADGGQFESDEYLMRVRPRSVLCLPILRQGRAAGYLYLENAFVPGVFTHARMEVLEVLSAQAAISLENAHLLKMAEEEQQKAAFLAEAGALLAESLECEEVLARFSKMVVERLADLCVFDIAAAERPLWTTGAHRDPAKTTLLRELERRYSAGRGSPHAAEKVIETGEPLLLPVLTDEVLRAYTVDAGHMSLIRELGARTAIVVPLRARGHILGALTLASVDAKRQYGPSDLAFALELARRAAMAIDNAFLYRNAKNAIQLREDFISIASHELRTPLTPLKAQLQLLTKMIRSGEVTAGPKGEVLKRLIGESDQQIFRLSRLIEDMLDASRVRSGRLAFTLEEVDLSVLVHEVIETLNPQIIASKCAVEFHPPGPIRGKWDRFRLEQVVTNLMTNAMKYGAGKPIEVSVSSRGDRAKLTVRDYGIGILHEDQLRIFDRFERAVSVTSFGGMGLGLYITRQIVEALGGTIHVESEQGHGSCFTVVLPLSGKT